MQSWKKNNMESTLDIVPLKDIDKSGWQTFRFDQIAKNISERVEPTDTDLEVYVGLEHIDSDSIHIKRFGKREDVSGTKLRCYPGDVIFGRRRAYQRKAAIMEFDGFCSAHSLVLRANPAVIDPQLFPFFLHSDAFMHRAMDISVGSLSPTINWGTLKKQEFLLPPKDQQAQLAELLWAADEVVEREKSLKYKLEELADLKLSHAFVRPNENFSKYDIVSLQEACIVQTGLAKNKKNNKSAQVEMPYLSVANVQDGFLDLSNVKNVVVAEKDIGRYSVKPGDVLINEGGDFDKVGRGTVWRGEIENCLHQNHVFCIRPIPGMAISDFISFQTGSIYGKKYFLKCAKKTSNLASINSTQVKSFPLILPPLNEQTELVENITDIKGFVAWLVII